MSSALASGPVSAEGHADFVPDGHGSALRPTTSIPSIKSIQHDVEAPSATTSVPIITESTQVWPTLSTFQKIIIPFITTMAMIMQSASSIGVSLLIRPISVDLDIPAYEVQWLASTAVLGFVTTLLLFGRIADIYRHKPCFVLGLIVATLFNLACALAQTKNQIFVFRAISGCGFACSIPAGLGILATSFKPGPAKSRAFAAFSAGAPTGAVVGLLLSGLTAETTAPGWRTNFYLLTGICALLVISAIFIVPGRLLPHRKSSSTASDNSIDYIGALLAVSGLVLFAFALADGSGAEKGWKTPYIPTFLAVGVLLMIGFLVWEWHVENRTDKTPLMRLSIWKKGKFAVLQLAGFLLFGAFTTTMFYMSMYWENYEHLAITAVTARFVPFTVAGISMNVIGAVIVSRLPAQVILLGGLACTALSCLLLAIMDTAATYWAYQFVATCLLVMAADAFFLIALLYASTISSKHEQAQAGGIISTITQLSSIVVLAISTIISSSVQVRESAKIGQPLTDFRNTPATSIPRPALLKSYKAAWWFCFALEAAAILVVLIGCRGMGYVGSKRTAKAAPVQKPMTIAEEGEKP